MTRQNLLKANIYRRRLGAMQNTAYGTYKNGQILLDAPNPAIDGSRVQVIFLNEEVEKNSLMDIFDVLY